MRTSGWLLPLATCTAVALSPMTPTAFAAASPDPLTGHYYDEVAATATWDVARTNAMQRTLGGLPGHLATVANERENLIVQHLGGIAERWIGLTDSTATSSLDGFSPSLLGAMEAGNTSGLPLPSDGMVPGPGQRGFGFRWITGEPYDWMNWRPGAPAGSPLGNDGVYMIVQGVWQDAAAGATLGEPGGPVLKRFAIEHDSQLDQARFRVSERQAASAFGNGTLPSLAQADALFTLPEGHEDIAASARASAYVVSFHDPDLGGGVPGLVRSPTLLNVPGVNENHFAIRASGQVVIPEPGQWTFAVASANAFRLRVGGNEFVGAGMQPTAPPRLVRAEQGTMTAAPGGDGASFYFAEAGVFDLFLTTFDSGSFAFVQLLAAEGTPLAYTAELFRLVGDEMNGGLALACEPRLPPELRVALEILPGGAVRLGWDSHPCRGYGVEASDDLQMWETITAGLHPGGPGVVVDEAPGGAHRFYRVFETEAW